MHRGDLAPICGKEKEMSGFNIKAAEDCRYDEVSLGEVMMRIDPVDVPTARARAARIWHGGGETNVAEGLAYCFGMRTAVVTALVDDGIGRNIECQLREAGVDTSHIVWFATDGGGRFSRQRWPCSPRKGSTRPTCQTWLPRPGSARRRSINISTARRNCSRLRFCSRSAISAR